MLPSVCLKALTICLYALFFMVTAPCLLWANNSSDRLFYRGKVIGKSDAGTSISIMAAGGDRLVKFDQQTIGLEYAIKGYSTLIFYEMRQGEPYATEIKPKLVQLPAGVTEIKLAGLKALIDSRQDYTLIDSRPARRYAEGHLPGAISIPMCEMKELLGLLPLDQDALLIFYCGGANCGLSTNNAAMAVQYGYSNVRVFVAGEPGWRQAGYPVFASYGFIHRGNIILADLRNPAEARVEHLPRAISMPLAELEQYMENIPLKAPVVLYSDDESQSLAAMQRLRNSGYAKVSLIQGGLDGWIGRGGVTEAGSLLPVMAWQRPADKDEVSLAAFQKAHDNKDPGVLILDVRSADEAETGRLAAALHIPLEQVCSRLAELPRDKTIYVYCSNGARAEMAAKELQKYTFDAFFLMAEVTCTGNTCEFRE